MRSMPLVQREVMFPHGRYVLREDGVTEPYQWLWVPNPAASSDSASSSTAVARFSGRSTDGGGHGN